MDEVERVVIGTITVEQEVTEELIESIVGTAFDWGPGWITAVRRLSPVPDGATYVEEIIAKGGRLQITEGDDFGATKRHTLTRDMVLNGIKLWAQLPYGRTPDQLEDDPSDAVESENILQLALFGEIIYG